MSALGVPFRPGEARTVAAARKGGQRTAAARRKVRGPWSGDVLRLMDAAGLTGSSWTPWRRLWRCSLALPQGPGDGAFLLAHTGRQQTPTAPVAECWVVAGRRGGKSRMAGLVALTKALQFDAAHRLAPGELAVVPIIAADRRQARVVLHYLRALCDLAEVRPFVHRVLREGVELRTGVNIEIHTASLRTIRGYTVIAAVLDEVAFWRDETTSLNPDSEILDALRPGMATVPDALLCAISSPYARRGALFEMYDRYYGQDDPHVVIWNADTRTLNPVVPEHVITRAYAEDPAAAASEYGTDGAVSFRTDVEAYVDPAAVAAVTVQDRRELAPLPGLAYVAFADPAGGSGTDSFTLAIAHREGAGAVLDLVRERRPGFSPDAVVAEFAEVLRSYGLTTVTGDHYAGAWPAERFAAHGIAYTPSERTKSELYGELMPGINAARVQLLDVPVLRAQFATLERRTSRAGKDSIDHVHGAHDDVVNAVAGALVAALPAAPSGSGKHRALWSLGADHWAGVDEDGVVKSAQD